MAITQRRFVSVHDWLCNVLFHWSHSSPRATLTLDPAVTTECVIHADPRCHYVRLPTRYNPYRCRCPPTCQRASVLSFDLEHYL